MRNVTTHKLADWVSVIPEKLSDEVTEQDVAIFNKITNTSLSAEQQHRISHPTRVFPRQQSVLAVHWHPEFIPMPLIEQRIAAAYPAMSQSLIIPTQHNELLNLGDYAGVEVDCYSRGFNQKVQLLLHFEKSRVETADHLKAMLAHTFKYRSSQLFEFIETITRPKTGRLNRAAQETGANNALIQFVRVYVRRIEKMIDRQINEIPPAMLKNKILRNFFDELRETYGDALIDRVQAFLKTVKAIVKANFSLHYFYRTSEIIEEARALHAGIVIPHPEQFWPILLANYDIDGIEVWNPQSQKYTQFLISVITRNRHLPGSRELLVFMGDDTHMAEKIRDPHLQDTEKAGREIGWQPAWDDFSICKALINADTNREKAIEQYKQRLAA